MKPVLILTGSSGVLGRAFATLFSDSFQIIGVSRSRETAQGCLDHFAGDVRDCGEALADYALNRYGRVDVLINNAASLNVEGSFKSQRTVSFLEQVHVNLVAPFDLIRCFHSRFWAKEESSKNEANNRNILNISSILSARHVYLAGDYAFHYSYACYAASKRGLNCLTKYLSDEMRIFGVRVNALAPGAFPQEQSAELICREIYRVIMSKDNGKFITIERGVSRSFDSDFEYAQGFTIEETLSYASKS